MSKTIFQHICTKCQQHYEVETNWIDPKLYSKPEKATKTLGFWCKNTHCGVAQAVLLQMLPNNEIKVIKKIKYNSLITQNNYTYYTNNHPKDVSTESESDKLTHRLTEEIALNVIGKLNIN